MLTQMSLEQDTYPKKGRGVLSVEELDVEDCPEEYQEFIAQTSLEKLVYWKIRLFFDHINTQSDLGRYKSLDLFDKVGTHVQRSLLALALKKTNGNLSASAKILGASRNTLQRILKEAQISTKEVRTAIRRQKKSSQDLL